MAQKKYETIDLECSKEELEQFMEASQEMGVSLNTFAVRAAEDYVYNLEENHLDKHYVRDIYRALYPNDTEFNNMWNDDSDKVVQDMVECITFLRTLLQRPSW